MPALVSITKVRLENLPTDGHGSAGRCFKVKFRAGTGAAETKPRRASHDGVVEWSELLVMEVVTDTNVPLEVAVLESKASGKWGIVPGGRFGGTVLTAVPSEWHPVSEAPSAPRVYVQLSVVVENGVQRDTRLPPYAGMDKSSGGYGGAPPPPRPHPPVPPPPGPALARSSTAHLHESSSAPRGTWFGALDQGGTGEEMKRGASEPAGPFYPAFGGSATSASSGSVGYYDPSGSSEVYVDAWDGRDGGAGGSIGHPSPSGMPSAGDAGGMVTAVAVPLRFGEPDSSVPSETPEGPPVRSSMAPPPRRLSGGAVSMRRGQSGGWVPRASGSSHSGSGSFRSSLGLRDVASTSMSSVATGASEPEPQPEQPTPADAPLPSPVGPLVPPRSRLLDPNYLLREEVVAELTAGEEREEQADETSLGGPAYGRHSIESFGGTNVRPPFLPRSASREEREQFEEGRGREFKRHHAGERGRHAGRAGFGLADDGSDSATSPPQRQKKMARLRARLKSSSISSRGSSPSVMAFSSAASLSSGESSAAVFSAPAEEEDEEGKEETGFEEGSQEGHPHAAPPGAAAGKKKSGTWIKPKRSGNLIKAGLFFARSRSRSKGSQPAAVPLPSAPPAPMAEDPRAPSAGEDPGKRVQPAVSDGGQIASRERQSSVPPLRPAMPKPPPSYLEFMEGRRRRVGPSGGASVTAPFSLRSRGGKLKMSGRRSGSEVHAAAERAPPTATSVRPTAARVLATSRAQSPSEVASEVASAAEAKASSADESPRVSPTPRLRLMERRTPSGMGLGAGAAGALGAAGAGAGAGPGATTPPVGDVFPPRSPSAAAVSSLVVDEEVRRQSFALLGEHDPAAASAASDGLCYGSVDGDEYMDDMDDVGYDTGTALLGSRTRGGAGYSAMPQDRLVFNGRLTVSPAPNLSPKVDATKHKFTSLYPKVRTRHNLEPSESVVTTVYSEGSNRNTNNFSQSINIPAQDEPYRAVPVAAPRFFGGGNPYQKDPVVFSCFAPPGVEAGARFDLTVRAYLRHERDAALREAMMDGAPEAGRPGGMRIGRGKRVTVEVFLPEDTFKVLSPNQPGSGSGASLDRPTVRDFVWTGEDGVVQAVNFLVECKRGVSPGRVECEARVVEGRTITRLSFGIEVVEEGAIPRVLGGGGQERELDTVIEEIKGNMAEIPFKDLEFVADLGSGVQGQTSHYRWQGKDVAVKSLTSYPAFDPSRSLTRSGLEHEATILSLLSRLGNTSHIVEFYGLSRRGGSVGDEGYHLVTKLEAGGSIEDALGVRGNGRGGGNGGGSNGRSYRNGHVAPSNGNASYSNGTPRGNGHAREYSGSVRTAWATDIARGLASAHAAGVLHNDVASRNALLSAPGLKGRGLLCDFGLSRFLRGSGIEKTFLIDPEAGGDVWPVKQMPPESLVHPYPLTAESDTWMFGLFLHEVFEGSQPWAGVGRNEVMRLVLEGKKIPEVPQMLVDRGDSMVKLYRACLSSDGARRPSMEHVVDELSSNSLCCRMSSIKLSSTFNQPPPSMSSAW